jgi:hypothetical protein
VASLNGDVDLITGHYNFGTHNLIENSIYFIVLRNPIDRVWSLIRYICAKAEHSKHALLRNISWELSALYSVKERGTQFDNGMTWQLNSEETPKNVAQDHFNFAAAVLKRRDIVVAFSDEMEKGMERLSARVGFEFGVPAVTNSSPPLELKAYDRNLIAAHNGMDMRLYDLARKLHAA